MPYKNPEDRRKNWTKWYHAHKEEYDAQYAERRKTTKSVSTRINVHIIKK